MDLRDFYEPRIKRAVETIITTYSEYQRFLGALVELPGTHGITDISVAQESISDLELPESASLNLAVIVQTEPDINMADARSRVTDALDGYVRSDSNRVKYEFRTFAEFREPSADLKPALTSVLELRENAAHRPVRRSDPLLEALRS